MPALSIAVFLRGLFFLVHIKQVQTVTRSVTSPNNTKLPSIVTGNIIISNEVLVRVSFAVIVGLVCTTIDEEVAVIIILSTSEEMILLVVMTFILIVLVSSGSFIWS